MTAPQGASAARIRPRLAVRGADLNVLAGHTALVEGALQPRLADRVVALQVHHGKSWLALAWARTGSKGRFTLRYRPERISSSSARLRFAGDAQDLAVSRPLGRLNAYRAVEASWYGGGGSLACGGTLTESTLGVANRTLPCGTLVTLRYGDRTVTVPVIDRGPYVEGREFDLTEATKRALGFGDLGVVWATS